MLSLHSNQIEDDGASALMASLLENEGCRLHLLDLSRNRIGPDGAKAVAAVCALVASVTRVDVRYNNIAGDGASQLSAAVLGNEKIEVFNAVPIKEMRTDSFTELNLNGKDIGPEGGMVVAGLIPVMAP